MTTIYHSYRDRSLKYPNSQFLQVPVVPSLGMIAAAAEATDIFLEGDHLWQWFDSYEEERDLETIHVDAGLIGRYGVQKAFAMACLADLWGAMLEGVEHWLTMRARNPRSAEDLIHYLPDHCPKGGWPIDKAACTEAHRIHARFSSEPFSAYWTAWQGIDPEHDAVVPRRLPESVAQGAARTYLSVGTYMTYQDIFKLSACPYVPGMTKEAYFMDEEAHLLVLSAMWGAAIAWLTEGDMEDAVPFPYHPAAQAEILTHMVFAHDNLWRKVDDFIRKTPFDRLSVHVKGAMLSIATTDGKSSYWYQESGGRMVRHEGLSLRVGRDRSGLGGLLRRVSRMDVKTVEAIPLGAPWESDG
ncbi:hypothetical protein O9X98_10880 [Agrobacterium salinitolerans]|nr:hypothetical protein [Agrobacterium salinitolerans]